MNVSIKALKSSTATGKLLSFIGYMFCLYFLIKILVVFGKPVFSAIDALLCFLFLAIGIFLIFTGKLSKKTIKRYQKYIPLLSEQHITSLAEIADIMMIPFDTVKKDILLMMRQKILMGTVIDSNDNLVASGAPSAGPVQAAGNTAYPVSFKCPNCGAVNMVQKGVPGICEYCGSPLNQ